MAVSVAPDRCEHCGHLVPLFTPEQMLEALRAWASEHGRAPRFHDWGDPGYGRPTSREVTRVFGRWQLAIKQAGLKRTAPRNSYWTRERIADAMLDFKFANGGRWPTPADWAKASLTNPVNSTVYLRFRSWGDALNAAGRPKQSAAA
jgi:hypothetical protein